MALPVGIPLILGVGGWAARMTGAVKLAAVAYALVKIYWLISLISIAFWLACMFFAKELFAWFCDVMISMVGLIIEATGTENPGPEIVSLVNQLPDVILDLWVRLGLWDGVTAMLAAYALNMALRCIPLVGGIFKG